MNIDPCDRRDLATFDDYVRSLSSPYDSYLEKAIAESQFYRVVDGKTEIGGIAIHERTLLTYFHLVGSAARRSPELWAYLVGDFGITAAYVPTSDEQFLSQALAEYRELKLQGCTFHEGAEIVRPDNGISYRPAIDSDLARIIEVSGDFLDPVATRLAGGELHVGMDADGEMVAVGLAEPAIYMGNFASIGMLTAESHRRRGIGTGMIRHLRGVCRDSGVTPVAGCWYYNHASRATLEAAGMVTTARLLNVDLGVIAAKSAE